MNLIDNSILCSITHGWEKPIPIGKIKEVTISRSPLEDMSMPFEAELDKEAYKRILDNKFLVDYSSFAFSPQLSIDSPSVLSGRIKKVIFNPPATIVLWKDGTKTVVKCKEGDQFDKWAGLSLCISKKIFGKRFHRVFKEWCDKEEK